MKNVYHTPGYNINLLKLHIYERNLFLLLLVHFFTEKFPLCIGLTNQSRALNIVDIEHPGLIIELPGLIH